MKEQIKILKKHILTGTSHMIPFIVAGGILFSISVMLNPAGAATPTEGWLAGLAEIGLGGLTLFVPVLGGYIAYSIADKPGLAPGMIGAYLANSMGAGFLGGMAVPAVIRFGYGYVQGADAAAQELGINVQMNYYYGGQFYGDEKITAKMDGWYDGGTEVVFACGGGIWTSAAEAADKHDGKLIGVDVDQNYLGVEGVESGKYKANPFVTSAMKGLGAAVKNGLDTVNAGDWSTIAGTNGNFGLEEGDYVGLPTDEASWNFSTFTLDEYNTVLEKIRNGEIKVDNNSDDATKPTTSSNITVDYQV